VINGGAFTIPDALGNKIIHPYGDFLLHDIGTGDGVVQNPPLTLANAIERHRGEAEREKDRFRELSDAEKQALFTFLNSL
jgi:CxxC motif-containing protein (DUF1111 family)